MEISIQKEYSDLIFQLRYNGELRRAIEKCEEATNRFPDNNFFYKILGDLYTQDHEFKKASQSYLKHLMYLQGKAEYFKNFARFYNLLKTKISKDELEEYRTEIFLALKNGDIPPDIAEQLRTFLGGEFIVTPEIREIMRLTDDDRQLKTTKKSIEQLVKQRNMNGIRAILDYRIHADKQMKLTNVYLISVAERLEMLDDALRLIGKLDFLDPTTIRTLLRICRKLEDYSYAEERLKMDESFIEKSDFNIQYELVYYYEYYEDLHLLGLTLKKMKGSASGSLPIARTLYNFYLRFNMFDDARQISEHIKTLEERTKKVSKVKRLEAQYESEQGVWTKLQELVSEQEHNRQMIAIRDLIRGFSHELGQPITNIRYAVQLYQMKAEMGELSGAGTEELLTLILRQTERIGVMLDRFRPIVSSKSKEEQFNLYDRINDAFENLAIRLQANKIKYIVEGEKDIFLWGDPVQFDQIFYNLILNSMQAIASHAGEGSIEVSIRNLKTNLIQVIFLDNGPGIAEEYVKKVFEPFFTTKDPSTDNGGEGLGLFIVWNILKMFNGRITLDMKYKRGAKFIIEIKKTEGEGNI